MAHYSRREVQKEVARFSRDRWVALHCELRDKKRRPISCDTGEWQKEDTAHHNDPEGIPVLLERFGRLRPRASYASANVYGK